MTEYIMMNVYGGAFDVTCGGNTVFSIRWGGIKMHKKKHIALFFLILTFTNANINFVFSYIL